LPENLDYTASFQLNNKIKQTNTVLGKRKEPATPQEETIRKIPKKSQAKTNLLFSLASGSNHSACIDKEKNLWLSGKNAQGQLGLGDNKDRPLFHKLPELTKIISVSCGRRFTICLNSNGVLWSFGANSKGQLGLGDTNPRNIPTRVPITDRIKSIHCGAAHTMCVSSTKVWAFGLNNCGQLGIRNEVTQLSPHLIDVENIKQIACGKYHSIALDESGNLFGTGNNERAQLGKGDRFYTHFKQIIHKIPNIVSISCGDYFTVVLTESGEVYGIGDNGCGQLGFRPTGCISTLTKMNSIPAAIQISCKCNSTLVIDADRKLWGVGSNASGELGLGKSIPSLIIALQISDLSDCVAVSNGARHTLVFTDRNLVCFGLNDCGQLGFGDKVNRNEPVVSQYFATEIPKTIDWKMLKQVFKWDNDDVNDLQKYENTIHFGKDMPQGKTWKDAYRATNDKLLELSEFVSNSGTTLMSYLTEQQQLEKQIKEAKERYRLLCKSLKENSSKQEQHNYALKFASEYISPITYLRDKASENIDSYGDHSSDTDVE